MAGSVNAELFAVAAAAQAVPCAPIRIVTDCLVVAEGVRFLLEHSELPALSEMWRHRRRRPECVEPAGRLAPHGDQLEVF